MTDAPKNICPLPMVAPFLEAMHNTVPVHLHDGLRNYVVFGRPVGSFLQAVITGDLFDAAKRADPLSATALCDLALLFYYYAPSVCFGSPAAYEAWLEKGKASR